MIPGGVNSAVRAFGAVGGVPRFFERGSGARVRDADGNEYIDYVGSWGPLILGHANPDVLRAVQSAMERGTSFGAPTELEVAWAERVCDALPSVERVRMVSSGTEASMCALRVARAATGRDRVLKFDGCYHGHLDALLVGAGSGVATLGLPGSEGVPKAFTDQTVVAPFNDLAAVESAFSQWGNEIACVIVEPVAGNMGCIPPAEGFLAGLREICDRRGALLILDEVMTGFRVAYGGAQLLYGVEPDLTCLGKVVGGGLPAAAFGGRADLMDRVAPVGPVFQAGTLSGNPLAVAAGLETLTQLAKPGLYEGLETRARQLMAGFEAAAADCGVALCSAVVGGMFGFFFQAGPVRNFADAKQSDTALFARFFHAMLEGGVYLAPSAYEAGFVSTAHGEAEISATLEAARKALPEALKPR